MILNNHLDVETNFSACMYIFNCFLFSFFVFIFACQLIATGGPVVVIICPNIIRDAWYTAYLQTSTGTLSEITQRSLLPSPDISKCFILAPTSSYYPSTTELGQRLGYVGGQYRKVGPFSLGAWEDVVIAVRVMGVGSFASYFSLQAGAAKFFVTYNGLILDPDATRANVLAHSYYVSYYVNGLLPGGSGLRAAPLTDGANSIVLGSFPYGLPILGKIDLIISLQGTLISTSFY